jgi:hypothetical protein
MKDPKRRTSEPTREQAFAALRRELGFDDLNADELFRELFGDALDLEPPRDGPVRVEQVVDGPQRRKPTK